MKLQMKIVGVILGLLFSVSSLAAEDCFWAQRVRNFDGETPTTLTVDAGRDRYNLTVEFCRELPWSHRIGFQSFGSRVCRGDRVLILDSFSNQIKQSCRILKIVKAN